MSCAYHVAQLRHAYTHLIAERVGNQKEFARGLISPAIQCFERLLAFDPAIIEAFDAAERVRINEKWAKRRDSDTRPKAGDAKQGSARE